MKLSFPMKLGALGFLLVLVLACVIFYCLYEPANPMPEERMPGNFHFSISETGTEWGYKYNVDLKSDGLLYYRTEGIGEGGKVKIDQTTIQLSKDELTSLYNKIHGTRLDLLKAHYKSDARNYKYSAIVIKAGDFEKRTVWEYAGYPKSIMHLKSFIGNIVYEKYHSLKGQGKQSTRK